MLTYTCYFLLDWTIKHLNMKGKTLKHMNKTGEYLSGLWVENNFLTDTSINQ